MSGWKSQLTSEYVNARYGETVALLQSVGLEVDPVVAHQAVVALSQQVELTCETTVYIPKMVHIIVTGQSNSVGNDALPLFVNNPAQGRMFTGGLKPGLSSLTSITPLIEGNTTTAGQTVSTTMVNWLSDYALNSRDIILVSHVGVDGTGYDGLKKGTTPYDHSMAQVAAAKVIADAGGLIHEVLAVVNIHGEYDDSFQRAAYRAELTQWQSDYEADCKAITGQTADIPMFLPAQAAGAPERYNNGSTTLAGASAINLLLASQDSPGKVIHVGPENFLLFSEHPHFDAFSHAWLGEYIARAIKQTVIDETAFTPLYGTSAVRTDGTIVIQFNVPTPPLQFNYDHTGFREDKGFSFRDSNDDTTVTNVAITGPSEVTITLSQTPTGTDQQIRYQCRALGEPKLQEAGNLTDSAVADTNLQAPTYNFACSFFLPVT